MVIGSPTKDRDKVIKAVNIGTLTLTISFFKNTAFVFTTMGQWKHIKGCIVIILFFYLFPFLLTSFI